MAQFKLSWRPDSAQPLAAGATEHVDPVISPTAVQVTVQDPVVEVNGVLDLRKWCPPVDNQLSISDCVADSSTAALEFLEIRNGLPFVKKSRLFLYYNARLQTQDTDKDEGTYIRLAFSTLTSSGTCDEATWPYDTGAVFTRPSWPAYQEAYARKVNAYYRITASGGHDLVDQIKQALQSQHPVVFGMIIDNDYMNTGADGIVAMPSSNRQDPGGHAQMICGYDDNARRWIVRNSWSTAWGRAGYAYVPYDYLDVSQANDFWVPTLAPPRLTTP